MEGLGFEPIVTPKNVQQVRSIISSPESATPTASANDFKALFQAMYLLNRELNQGIIRIASGEATTMQVHGVGSVDPTNALGQFILTTTLGEYENIVGAATNLMEAERKIEDYLQKII